MFLKFPLKVKVSCFIKTKAKANFFNGHTEKRRMELNVIVDFDLVSNQGLLK